MTQGFQWGSLETIDIQLISIQGPHSEKAIDEKSKDYSERP